MAHEWKNNNSPGFERIGEDEMRKCIKCGVEQSFQGTGTWLRIGTKQWLPLVGRCKADKKFLEPIRIKKAQKANNI